MNAKVYLPVKVMTDTELPLIAKVIYAYKDSYAGYGSNNDEEIKENILHDLGITMADFKYNVDILNERGYVK